MQGLCIPGVTWAVVVAILYLSRRYDVRMYRSCAGVVTRGLNDRSITHRTDLQLLRLSFNENERSITHRTDLQLLRLAFNENDRSITHRTYLQLLRLAFNENDRSTSHMSM